MRVLLLFELALNIEFFQKLNQGLFFLEELEEDRHGIDINAFFMLVLQRRILTRGITI